MKNTKTNVVKVLEKLRNNAHNIADYFKEEKGDEEEYRRYLREAEAYYVAITLLENQEFFNNIAKNLEVK